MATYDHTVTAHTITVANQLDTTGAAVVGTDFAVVYDYDGTNYVPVAGARVIVRDVTNGQPAPTGLNAGDIVIEI